MTAIVVVATLGAWVVYVYVPQQVRASQPIIISQASLLSQGPYVGCFDFLSAGGTVVPQGRGFQVSWDVLAPSNATPSCTVESILSVIGPGEGLQAFVASSNLPVTIPSGNERVVQISFAPLYGPAYGSITVNVVETNP